MTQASVHSMVRTQGFVAIIMNGGVPLPDKGKLLAWYTKFAIPHFILISSTFCTYKSCIIMPPETTGTYSCT